ncbi:hypothetical protein Tco_0556148 [Tanacetum coccineum]
MAGNDDRPPTPPSTSDKLIPFGVTSITNNVPVKLNLEKMNYNSWSSFFKIHLGSIGLKHHIKSATPSSSDRDWSRLDDLVKVWILGTCTESLQDHVVTTPGTAKDLWNHIKDLFHENEDAWAINLDNQLLAGEGPLSDKPIVLQSKENEAANDDMIKSGEIKVKSDPSNVNSGFVVNTGHFGLILVASKLSLVATILILVELATQQRQNSDRQLCH